MNDFVETYRSIIIQIKPRARAVRRGYLNDDAAVGFDEVVHFRCWLLVFRCSFFSA
jgi:hypothetical protein